LNNSRRLLVEITAMFVMSVTLPPGCARLSTKPVVTGSVTPMNTMGIVVVACLAACAAFVVTATRTSGLGSTSSAASAGSHPNPPPSCSSHSARLLSAGHYCIF
jgi:hypothetical protein